MGPTHFNYYPYLCSSFWPFRANSSRLLSPFKMTLVFDNFIVNVFAFYEKMFLPHYFDLQNPVSCLWNEFSLLLSFSSARSQVQLIMAPSLWHFLLNLTSYLYSFLLTLTPEPYLKNSCKRFSLILKYLITPPSLNI